MKKNQNIVFNIAMIVFALVVFGGMVWLSYSKASDVRSAATQGALEVSGSLISEEPVFNFGEISMANGFVRHSYLLKNVGTSSVTVSKMYTSCMCTAASLLLGDKKVGPFGMPGHGLAPRVDAMIRPGEEFEVEAVFDPTAHGPAGVGPVDRSIYLELSDGIIELQFTALVKP